MSTRKLQPFKFANIKFGNDRFRNVKFGNVHNNWTNLVKWTCPEYPYTPTLPSSAIVWWLGSYIGPWPAPLCCVAENANWIMDWRQRVT